MALASRGSAGYRPRTPLLLKTLAISSQSARILLLRSRIALSTCCICLDNPQTCDSTSTVSPAGSGRSRQPNAFSGEKEGAGVDKSGGRTTYDPDLAHAAAFTNDGDLTVPTGINERKLLTKIDIRVIPCLSVLYLMAFLDRTNIANAGSMSSVFAYGPSTYVLQLSLSYVKTWDLGDWSTVRSPATLNRTRTSLCRRSETLSRRPYAEHTLPDSLGIVPIDVY